MKQRLQSILFFLSALLTGVLFFMPMVSYLDEYGTYYKLFVYGINTVNKKFIIAAIFIKIRDHRHEKQQSGHQGRKEKQ